MHKIHSTPAIVLLVVTAIAVHGSVHSAKAQQTGDVVRVNTDLVQTSATVVDKQGKPVTGLQREQFQLKIDSVSRPISFFEQVTTGSAKEEKLTSSKEGLPAVESRPVTRGRTILFFVDDLHLSLQSLERTRSMLLNFIDKEKLGRDEVAIASSSGQIGFLQQFSDNDSVLRAAVGRLTQHPNTATGYGFSSQPMTDFIALIIDSKADSRVADFYIDDCVRQTSTPKKNAMAAAALRMTCETQVKNSARAILMQAANITSATYGSLRSLLQISAHRPGRKLAFFVSDGFLLDTGRSGVSLRDKLDEIIDSAQRSGVIVYTIDAKGLVSGSLDATNNVPEDPNQRLATIATRDIAASQDALHALASDTGGRAIRNQNVFDHFVKDVLQETSNYYLIAWRPESQEQKDKNFRKVEISIVDRPDLTVRLPKGYFEADRTLVKPTAASATPKTPAREIGEALSNAVPSRGLHTILSLSYLNTPTNGMVLTSSTQTDSSMLSFGEDGKTPASLDLAGVVLNDKGKVAASFQNRLTVKPAASGSVDDSKVIYNQRSPLAPGIYQVRVAVRDNSSGRIGSAMQWVNIPDLASHHLVLSSVLLGGEVVNARNKSQEPQLQFSVDRRFARNSHLPFWVFVYNAIGTERKLSAHLEILSEGQPVVVTKEKTLLTNEVEDPSRIPYTGTLPLTNLVAGYYELRIVVSDTTARTTASQTVEFEVQ